MMIRYAALLALAGPLALSAAPAAAQDQSDAPLIALVKDFVAAERDFDQKRLAALITADYAEVSPLGELDLHDAFLGFYAADKKQPSPPMMLGAPLVRRYGDAASILTTLSFERPGPDGQPRTASIRVGFMAVKANGAWKLASAQYTPERPKAPAPAPAK
jgi:ketosteroid isomerase-like protein